MPPDIMAMPMPEAPAKKWVDYLKSVRNPHMELLQRTHKAHSSVKTALRDHTASCGDCSAGFTCEWQQDLIHQKEALASGVVACVDLLLGA